MGSVLTSWKAFAKSSSLRTSVLGDLRLIAYRYSNLLLPFVPVAFAVQYTHQDSSIVFAMNLIAIFPCSFLMGIGLKSIGQEYGDLVKVILYMTFG